MQGTIDFQQPISNLLWNITTVIYVPRERKTVINVNIFLSEQDKQEERVLTTREYQFDIPQDNQGIQLVETAIISLINGQLNMGNIQLTAEQPANASPPPPPIEEPVNDQPV